MSYTDQTKLNEAHGKELLSKCQHHLSSSFGLLESIPEENWGQYLKEIREAVDHLTHAAESVLELGDHYPRLIAPYLLKLIPQQFLGGILSHGLLGFAEDNLLLAESVMPDPEDTAS